MRCSRGSRLKNAHLSSEQSQKYICIYSDTDIAIDRLNIFICSCRRVSILTVKTVLRLLFPLTFYYVWLSVPIHFGCSQKDFPRGSGDLCFNVFIRISILYLWLNTAETNRLISERYDLYTGGGEVLKLEKYLFGGAYDRGSFEEF